MKDNRKSLWLEDTKIEVSPEGDVFLYTHAEVQVKPGPAAAAKNALSLYGVTIETAADGKVIVHTEGAVKVSRPANDAAVAAHQDAPLEIGDVAENGTIFAGVSPHTGKPMFVLPADAPLTLSFRKAQEYAGNIADARGRRGFRVPTKEELQVIYDNRDKGALKNTFNQQATYWSATTAPRYAQDLRAYYDGDKSAVNKFTKDESLVHELNFRDGRWREWFKSSEAQLRCVR